MCEYLLVFRERLVMWHHVCVSLCSKRVTSSLRMITPATVLRALIVSCLRGSYLNHAQFPK